MPKRWIRRLNHLGMLYDNTPAEEGLWRSLLRQMFVNTAIFSILSVAATVMMLTFFLPFCRSILPHWWANGVCGLSTVIVISPFLRAIVMKKNHSDEFKALWTRNRLNRPPLIFTIIVRAVIAMAFVFYIVNYLSRFTHALMLSLALAAILIMVMSRRLKHNSIRMERMFVLNLRSREIAAQVQGHRRPLYADRLLDRSIHISDIVIPTDSTWAGHTLAQLNLGKRFGVHVSSILRGRQRINIPGGDNVIFPLDKLQVIGNDEQLAALNAAMTGELMPEMTDIEQREMHLRQITLTAGSPLIGKTLANSRLRDDYNCMLVGIEQGQENLTQVDPQHIFATGDILWVVTETGNDKLAQA